MLRPRGNPQNWWFWWRTAVCCPSTLLFLHGNTPAHFSLTFVLNFWGGPTLLVTSCLQFWHLGSAWVPCPGNRVCCLLELFLCSCTWAQCRRPAARGQMSLEARIPWFCDSSGAEAGSTIPEHMVQALAAVAVRLLYRLVLFIDCWRRLQLRKEILWANHLLWSLHGLGESVQMEW